MYKSKLIQFILTLIFGPLGLFYSTIAGALGLTIAAVLLALPTGGIGAIAIWIISIITGFVTVSNHNKVLDIEDLKHQELVDATKKNNHEDSKS